MIRRIATTINSTTPWLLITVTIVVELMLATASIGDEDRAIAAEPDFGCVAAAAEYHYFGDANRLPMTLIDGELYSRCYVNRG